MKLAAFASLTVALALPTIAAQPSSDQLNSWAKWRGPLGTGVAPTGEPPIEWSDNENVQWKVKVPGAGMSTPIIWKDQVFILTAIAGEAKAPAAQEPEPQEDRGRFGGRRRGGGGMTQAPTASQKFTVMSLDRNTGKVLWEQVAREEFPHEGHHRDHGFASSSPVTDGEHLFASFGSRGIYAYTLDGQKVWEIDLGDMRTRAGFGEGASPGLYGDTLVINWDNEDQSYIVALDKATGKEIWRRERDEATGWSTPVFVESKGRTQVVLGGTNKIRSYDLKTGELVWEHGGLTVNAIPTPVIGNGMIYLTSGYRGNALYAIKIDNKGGDLTGSSDVVWSYNRRTPYVPSPALSGDRLYLHKSNQGFLSCFDAKTGQPHYEEERIDQISGIYASPVIANGYLYVVGRDGTTVVYKDSPKLEVVAVNKVSDKVDASVAIVGKQLFLRGHEYLYCISKM